MPHRDKQPELKIGPNEYEILKKQNSRKIRGEIIRIASELVQCNYLPSDLVDDYPQKTYSASRVAQMMEKAHIKSKDLAVELRRLINELP